MDKYKLLYARAKAIVTGKSKPLASGPHKFTFSDWKFALLTTKNALSAKRIGILAAGIAYFATFAFFPLIAASVAIASIVINHDQLQTIVNSIEDFLPADISKIITTQLEAAFTNHSASVLVAVIGVAIALFSISGAVINLISASNVSYDREETRGFVKLRLTSLAIMLMGAIAGIAVVCLLLINEPLMISIGLPSYAATIISIVRWIVIAAIVTTMLAIFYRYGPDRANPKWQWVSWGSVIAGVVWLLGTALFFIYASHFANFSKAYSVFAGIIVLMTWFNLTSFIILLGAEINNRLENQTFSKTTK